MKYGEKICRKFSSGWNSKRNVVLNLTVIADGTEQELRNSTIVAKGIEIV